MTADEREREALRYLQLLAQTYLSHENRDIRTLAAYVHAATTERLK